MAQKKTLRFTAILILIMAISILAFKVISNNEYQSAEQKFSLAFLSIGLIFIGLYFIFYIEKSINKGDTVSSGQTTEGLGFARFDWHVFKKYSPIRFYIHITLYYVLSILITSLGLYLLLDIIF